MAGAPRNTAGSTGWRRIPETGRPGLRAGSRFGQKPAWALFPARIRAPAAGPDGIRLVVGGGTGARNTGWVRDAVVPGISPQSLTLCPR